METGEYQIDDHDIVRMLSLGRCAVGAFVVLWPRRAVRLWLGEDASAGMKHAARSLGARDVVLGIGTLAALEEDGDVARWLEAQAVSDAADAVGTVLNFRNMPRFRRWLLLATPVAAAALGLTLAERFSPAEPFERVGGR